MPVIAAMLVVPVREMPLLPVPVITFLRRPMRIRMGSIEVRSAIYDSVVVFENVFRHVRFEDE